MATSFTPFHMSLPSLVKILQHSSPFTLSCTTHTECIIRDLDLILEKSELIFFGSSLNLIEVSSIFMAARRSLAESLK